ncbi:uncharacterized protein [Prorops nasuta]|uniref:uncharacterized protein n=1 Tax=Prorops nasuta TaxID=863751 RepID=UPI0034CF87D6
MDHTDYCSYYYDDNDDPDEPIVSNDVVEHNNNVKDGDELLIDLYKERSFLYDKRNRNFKDIIMKTNAWTEISRIMTDMQKDGMYTPEYCQKRCKSLREQYNKEKRRVLKDCKSGSGTLKRSSFRYLAHLSFLDKVVKGRRTYTNSEIPSFNMNIDKNNELCDMESDILNTDKDKENETLSKPNVENNYLLNKGHIPNRMKKREIEKTKTLENTLLQMGQAMSSYMENKRTETCNVDDAFLQYLKLQFDSFSEKEKLLRKKMIMDALISPISENI